MKRACIVVAILLLIVMAVGGQSEHLERAMAQSKTDAGKKAAGKRSQSKKTVTIDSCHIMLIDHVELGVERGGILAFVEPHVGDTVQANQEVAGLKDGLAQAQLNTAKQKAKNDIEVVYAQAAHDFAKIDLQKVLDAIKRVTNAFAEIDVEEKRLAVRKAALQIRNAQFQGGVYTSQVLEAEEALKQYVVLAPIEGEVTEVHKHKGEPVREGEVILEITNTRRLKVLGYVHYADAVLIKKGDPVTVRMNLGDMDVPEEYRKTFSGKVTFKDLEATTTEEVFIHAEVDNPDGILQAGMTATMVVTPTPPGKKQTALK